MSVASEMHRRRVLAVLSAGNFTQLGARFLLSPVVPLVLVDFDTTKASVGLALTGLWAVYALLQFPSGILADRHGERRLLLVGLGGTVLGTALIAAAPSLVLYGAFVLVLGAGTGLFFSPGSSLLSRLFEDRGQALGTYTAAGAVAGVVYPAVGSFVGVAYGWRVAVALGAVLALPALLATVWFVPSVEPVNPNRYLGVGGTASEALALLSRPSVAYTTLLAILVSFAFQAVASFFPTFLVEYRGVDTTLAGVAFGGAFALSALAQPVVGRFSDRTSRDAGIAVSVSLAAAGLVVLLAVPGVVGVVAGTALLGVGISWPGPIQARFMDDLGEAERGFGFGLVRSVYLFLAAPGSVVVGTLAQTGGWAVGYGSVVAVLATCLVAVGTNRALELGL